MTSIKIIENLIFHKNTNYKDFIVSNNEFLSNLRITNTSNW